MYTSITYIYTLTDPFTGLVRYVGKSDLPHKRFNHGVLVNHKISLSKVGFKHTEEAKLKMSINSKGVKPSKSVREKISKKLIGNQNTKGLKHTEEFKKRMSEKFKGEKNPMYNKKHTEDTVNKIKDKLSVIDMYGENNPFYGKKHSDRTKDKMSTKVSKYSLNGELLDTYNSMTVASKENNITQ